MERKVRSVLSPWRRVRRGAKTLFFVITMLASLLLVSAPLLIAVVDLILPWALLSAFTSSPNSIRSISAQLRSYDFRASLVDMPFVSTTRSLIIICIYSVCNGPGISRGAYLGITILSSLVSVAYVSVKASVFGSMSQWGRVVVDGGRWREGLAMEALFLSSLVLAMAHMVAAYRISCRERRKLLVYRIDIEAVQVCTYGVHGHLKLCN